MITGIEAAVLTPPVSARDHIRGRITAPVILAEHGDFECPYCGRAHLVVEQIREELGENLAFVFRHFPLTTVHPHAGRAAEAAEAAGAQGKFWEMHDVLFENQDRLEDTDLVRYATELGLNVPRFVRELETGVYAPRVREDFRNGVLSGVNGTPTFFINGVRHDDGWDYQTLMAALIRAMEAEDEDLE